MIDRSELLNHAVACFLDDGVLMHELSPENLKCDWSTVFLVVIPTVLPCREYVICMAHDHVLSSNFIY